jgi:hypothetical protein
MMRDVTLGLFVLVLMAITLVAFMGYKAFGTEYYAISEASLTYCGQYARRSAVTVPLMNEAYGDCIRILPTRLPMPAELGSVPAADRPASGWSEACAAEYRTWDAETGTVVRRGSPDRVECPLVLRDGIWQLPDE